MRHPRKPASISQEDRAFLDEFFPEYEDFILFIARKFERPGIQAEDIRQEAMIRLMSRIPALRNQSHEKICGYLYETVKTSFIDLVRKEKKHSHVSMDSILEEVVGMERDLVPDLFMRQELQRLRKYLSPREWTALKGKYILGYSQEELGQQLDIAPDSVRMFLCRVREQARKILSPEKVTGGGDDD